jgi:hypothetical protein
MSKQPFQITVEKNLNNDNCENHINNNYVPKLYKRYNRKTKFKINIDRNIVLSFEPFFQDHQSYRPQIQYNVSRANPTPSLKNKIKFLYKLDIYPYNQIEPDIIDSL